MSSPPRKDFAVYDFNEEDEAVEKAERERLEKFGKLQKRGNPSADCSSPIDKVKFLRFFGSDVNVGKADEIDVIYVDSGEKNHECEVSRHACYTSGLSEANPEDDIHIPSEEESPASAGSQDSEIHYNQHEDNTSHDSFNADSVDEDRILSVNQNVPDCNISEHPLNHHYPDSNDDDDTWSASSSCHSPDDSEYQASVDQQNTGDCWSSFRGSEANDATITISPDFIVYCDRSYSECHLIFSPECIRIEYLDSKGRDEFFTSEWAIKNLTSIDSLWSQSVETAWIEIQSKQINVTGSNETYEVPGISSLTFIVRDPQWLLLEKKIKLLAPDYQVIWKESVAKEAVFPDDSVPTSSSFTSHYLTDFGETFEDVVYSEGDADAVPISQRDMELLQPETFINDTIIDFYIKYLKNKMKPEEHSRFHFFNSFFFRKLADMDKDPQNRLQGRAAFLCVRKWTRKVNIFEKDYIFIPVNFNLHWSLLVICHPGEIPKFKEEDINKSPKIPCLLHLDSLKGSHIGLKNPTQSYLWEEWKERNPDTPSDTSSKFMNLRFISLELPQQENMFDCGLFLLHYVELFLKEAPANFSPFSITALSSFLNSDWFVPAEASLKRFLIRNLLYDLLRHASRSGQFSCTNNDQSSAFTMNYLEKYHQIGLVSTPHYAINSGLLVDATASAPERTQLELWASDSSNISQGSEEEVGRQLFMPGTTTGTCIERDGFPFQGKTTLRKHKYTLCPIEEEKDILQPHAITSASQTCSSSYFPMDIDMHTEEDRDPLSENLSGSQNSPKQGLSQASAVAYSNLLSSPSVKKEADEAITNALGCSGHSLGNSAVPSSMQLLDACTVEDSQDKDSCLGSVLHNVKTSPSVLEDEWRDAKENSQASLSGALLKSVVEDSQEVANWELESSKACTSWELESCVVKDSQEVETKSDSNCQDDSLLSSQKVEIKSSNFSSQHGIPICDVSLDDDAQISGGNLVGQSENHQYKRQKLMHDTESGTRSERIQTRSLSRTSSF